MTYRLLYAELMLQGFCLACVTWLVRRLDRWGGSILMRAQRAAMRRG